MDTLASPLLDRYVPTRQAEKNFDANYWRGFRLSLLVFVALLIILLFVMGAIFKTDMIGVVLGDQKATAKEKGTAYTIIVLICVSIFVFLVLYIRKQGGLLGLGSDAKQTGYLTSPDLNSNLAKAQRDLIKKKEDMQAATRAQMSTLQARAIDQAAARNTASLENPLDQFETRSDSVE